MTGGDEGQRPDGREPERETELTLRGAQRLVDEWIRNKGVRYFSELTNLAQLVEEVGELARLVARKYGDQSFKAGENPDLIPDELADIMFVVICLANQMQVDLTDALWANLDKKNVRDGERHRNNPKLQKQPDGKTP